MFVTQLSQLHTVCAEEALARGFGQANLVRSVGETWFVDPRYGRGSYWFYLMDRDTIVVSMDITYERAVEAVIETIPYLGSASMNMRCPCIARLSVPDQTASS